MDAYDAVERDYQVRDAFATQPCRFVDAIRLLQNAIKLSSGECVSIEITGDTLYVVSNVGKYNISPENFRRILL